MSRHSKNNTANSIFTYHERKMITDMGTQKTRLGGESLRRFEDCWLCLRPARDPLCTPRGYVYCRECIVVNLAHQKEDVNRNMRLWEGYEMELAKEKQQDEMREKCEALTKFAEHIENPSRRAKISSSRAAMNNTPLGASQSSSSSSSSSSSQTTQSTGTGTSKRKFAEIDKTEARAKSFWVVENTPEAPTSHKVEKPSTKLMCPISHHPLRVKDLIKVKPQLSTGSSSRNESVGSDKKHHRVKSDGGGEVETCKWLCSVCEKQISHQKAIVVKFTGDVMCANECYENSVKGKSGYYGAREVTSDDVVDLITGGTGYSAHNKVEAEKYRATMQL